MSSDENCGVFAAACTSRWIRPTEFYGRHLSKCGRKKRLLKHWVRRDGGKAREGNLRRRVVFLRDVQSAWEGGGGAEKQSDGRIDGSRSGQDSGGDWERLA